MRQVVGVAVLEAGRVLAARRAAPQDLAGLWELPGGKVEPGEDPADAAVREIDEELGCAVAVDEWMDLERVVPTGPGDEPLVLRVAVARLVEGDPVPREHDAVRWLRADQLDEVPWVEADVVFLEPLRELMADR